MADALGATLSTLKLIGIISSIMTIISFVGLPILKEYGDEKMQDRFDPFLTSLMTISGIVTPVAWLLVYAFSSVAPVARQLSNEIQGTLEGGIRSTVPLLQNLSALFE